MEERMNINERYKYLRVMQARYRKARRKEKGRLLSEMKQMTGLHRKYLIQLMNGLPPQREKRRRQCGRKYGAQVDDAIRVIGAALDWICAERLKPVLPKMARHLAKLGELRVTAELLEQLEQIQTLICTCETITALCPLPIREIHPDNGSEFMNHHLYHYFGERLKGAKLSRSRPWQKNDNRFVEQKNYYSAMAFASLVRA